MFVYGFVETTETGALSPGEAVPAVTLIVLGPPKLRDIAIYAQALQPGQVLRVAGNLPQMRAVLETFCAAHGMAIVRNTWMQDMTRMGCYTHYYVDIAVAPTDASSPQ